MPCLEISMPRIDGAAKAKLARTLTDAFSDSTGFPGEIFGVLFKEYEYGTAATGGALCAAGDGRPYIHFLLYSPRLKRNVKQKLATAFSEAFVKAMDSPDWEPVIHFCEHPYDNVAVEGELLSDKYPELAEQRFYYETPDD